MSARIVPEYNMEDAPSNTPISGLDELQAHIAELTNDADLALNAKLFDDVELQLNESNIPPLLPTLLPPLTAILRQSTQDPSPLLSLAVKLLSPLTFHRCLTIADPASLVAALQSPLPGAILLAIAIIEKAAKTPADTALLSTLPDVVEELLRRWLDSPDVGVGERAGKVLGDLLETDSEVINGGVSLFNQPANGQALVRRRIPGTGRLWCMLFLDAYFVSKIVSLSTAGSTERQTTLAQGRVLRILPRLFAVKPRAVYQTPFTDLLPVPEPLSAQIDPGLLQWAALSMVDKSDLLMHLTLVDFFETFVSVMRIAPQTEDTTTFVRHLVRIAAQDDERLTEALRSLPDRTIEEEAEPLRRYIDQIFR